MQVPCGSCIYAPYDRLVYDCVASIRRLARQHMHALAERGHVQRSDVPSRYDNAQSCASLEERAVRGFEATAQVTRTATESLCNVEPDATENTP